MHLSSWWRAHLATRWVMALGLAVVFAVGVLILRPEARQGALTALPPRGPAPPPTLSTENKLQFQVILQRLEIAKLHYEAAQQDFAAAQRDAAALVDKTKVAGYDLDLQTFTYTPLPKK
jgi:hypothetical protein